LKNLITKEKITLFSKGMAMGTADLMPGVSGGTIALILGVYKELIQSIDSINLKNLKSLKNDGIKPFWSNINGEFLTVLFLGIITAILSLSFAIDWLIIEHPIPLWSFFLGLLLASIFILKNTLNQWSVSNSLLAIFSAALSFILTQMTPVDGEIGMLYLFMSGFFGIIAMILPGISGAYILLILGAYSTVISLIKNAITSLTSLQMEIMIPTFTKLSVFVLGIVLGLRIFASILKWLFDKEHDKTMAVMIGLMAGALHKLWPWQQKFEWTLGENSKTLSKPISPFEYPENPQLALAVVFFITGLCLVWILERRKNITPPK
jgi:putative membrane protein